MKLDKKKDLNKQEIINKYDDIEINTLQEAKTLNQVRNLMGNEIYHVTTKENFKTINKEGLIVQKEDYWNMDRTGIFLTTEKSVAQRYAILKIKLVNELLHY